MSARFCTTCGTGLDEGSPFCTNCGVRIADPGVSTIQVDPQDASASPPPVVELGDQHPVNPGRKRGLLRIGLIVVLIAAIGGGAFMVGRMSIDQDEIRRKEFSVGYDSGREAGYVAGYGEGVTDGRKQGCEGVFEFTDGQFQYVTPYAPFNFVDRYPGGYYASRDQC